MLKRTRRPSPALAISLIALFVALGGTGYAAVTINGKDIKNKSIAGKKLKNKAVTGGKVKSNTLTGTQINESTLAKVPSAANADKALAADKALTADKALAADKALTADKATTATTATSATTATTATNASKAATVDANGVNSEAIQAGAVTASKLGTVTPRSVDTGVADAATAQLSVGCEAGERALSGGVTFGGAAVNAAQALNTHLVRSGPQGTTGWSARVYNGSGIARTYTITVLCLG